MKNTIEIIQARIAGTLASLNPNTTPAFLELLVDISATINLMLEYLEGDYERPDPRGFRGILNAFEHSSRTILDEKICSEFYQSLEITLTGFINQNS